MMLKGKAPFKNASSSFLKMQILYRTCYDHHSSGYSQGQGKCQPDELLFAFFFWK